MSKHASHYDPTRDTVGTIYTDAQRNNRVEEKIEVGDMAHELMKSLVDDLNDGIKEGLAEWPGKEFYITIHEKKDLQMPNAFLRRMIKTLYRPWPEDDTVVFRIYPDGDVRFCWCLDHWTEMENKLAARELFPQDQINIIKAWKAVDLHCFGFVKTFEGNWIPNLDWVDQKLGAPKSSSFSLLAP